MKKKELDSKFNVDPQKSTIIMDDDVSIKEINFKCSTMAGTAISFQNVT